MPVGSETNLSNFIRVVPSLFNVCCSRSFGCTVQARLLEIEATILNSGRLVYLTVRLAMLHKTGSHVEVSPDLARSWNLGVQRRQS